MPPSKQGAVEKLLPPLEAATILGPSCPTLKSWIRQGKVKSTRTFEGPSRVPESEIAKEPSHPEIETLRAYGIAWGSDPESTRFGAPRQVEFGLRLTF